MFALDIPQCDVNGTDSTTQRGAPKRTHPIEILPVVFNPQRVLSDEIFLKGVDDFFNGFRVAPACGLSYPADAGIRVDAQHVAVSHQKRFDFINFHTSPSFSEILSQAREICKKNV